MTAPNSTRIESAIVNGVNGVTSIGDCLVPVGGYFVKATLANRTTAASRAYGVAVTAWGSSSVGSVQVQSVGIVDAATTGLGAGAASWVRVNDTTGRLERATVSGSDDVVGYCNAAGDMFTIFGLFTAAIANGSGGGGGTPGGSNTQLQYNNSSAFGGISGVTTDGTGLTALKVKSSSGSFYYTLAAAALAADRTITLPLLAGNDTFVFAAFAQTLTNKTIDGASNTLTVRIANDVSGLGANVATFLGTPSGPNLASALTSALSLAKVGAPTGSGFARCTAGAWDAATIGETGSGNVVRATSPTCATATNTGTFTTGGVCQTGGTSNNSTGTINNVSLGSTYRLEFTNAVGPTVTGIDATGIANGQIIEAYAAVANVLFKSENAGSTAGNRLTLQAGIDITLPTGCVTLFQYLTDGTNSRWRHLAATAI